MLVKILKPDFIFENEQGSLTQLVHSGWNQINVLVSAKGSKRGGHYHKLNREVFYIISGKIELSLAAGGETEKHQFQKGDMFLIPLECLHEFSFIEDTVMVAMYDIGVELPSGQKDIFQGVTDGGKECG